MATQSLPQVQPIPFPKRQITQTQLERIISLRNQVSALKADLETAEAEAKTALESGVEVEAGTHVASLKEVFRRNVAWREIVSRLGDRLYGDGKGSAYCARVIASTKPSRSVQLVVS